MKNFGKLLVMIVVAWVFVATGLLCTVTVAEPMYTQVRLTLRAQPGSSSKAVGYVDAGTEVDAHELVRDGIGKLWWYCDTPEGKGYLSYNSLEGNGYPDYSKIRDARKSETSHDNCAEEHDEKLVKASTHVSASSVKLVAKCETKAKQEGKTANVKAGTQVKATRFYPNGTCTVKAPNGRDCKCRSKDFRTIGGKSIPKLPSSAKLKVSMSIGGQKVSKGSKLHIEYYVFKGSELFANVGEGYVSTKYLSK